MKPPALLQRVSEPCLSVVVIYFSSENTFTHYESLDNLYDDKSGTDKPAIPSYKPLAPPSNKTHTKLVDDDTEEDYMKMAPSRSCSHATIRSDTLQSCENIKMTTLGNHDGTSHYNTLSSNHNHYDVPPSNLQLPPGNSLHSSRNHYDIPPNNKLASIN